MASDLERLADAVRALADPGGSVRPHVARASVAATRLSGSTPGGVPSAMAAASSFQAAGASLARASQALDAFARDAERFAASLAGHGEAGGSTRAPDRAGVGGTRAALPDGFTMVPLSALEDVEIDGWKHDVTPDDLAWGMQALTDVVLPGMARGLTIADFREMDAELDQVGNRSFADTYTGFFGSNDCLMLSPGASGKFHPENGRHRILVARQHGLTSLPAKVTGP